MRSDGELERWLSEHGVTGVECLVPDLTGVGRGRLLGRERFLLERGLRLPEAMLGVAVTGNAPTHDPAYARAISAAERDMVLLADPATIALVPWYQEPTAQVILDCHFPDGELVDFAPRSVLRRVLKLYADNGWQPSVAPELEFYLTARNPDPNLPLTPPIGRSGRAETSRQIYSIDAVNEFDPLFERLYDYCEQMRMDVVTLIHEIGAGQMGIDFLPAGPLAMADTILLFKRAVREVALQFGLHATFMAKPFVNEPGSAMHVHQGVLDLKSGRNLFADPDGRPSGAFHHFIGGLQRYMPEAMALVAPNVNSYRRLVQGSSAPINVQWGVDNRSVGFRVPFGPGDERTVENRIIGADANPYLALAATLACGYLGLKERIAPSPETVGNAQGGAHEVPQSLPRAVRALRQADRLGQVLGERFIDVYAAVKEQEYQEFMEVISPWEREHLLLHV